MDQEYDLEKLAKEIVVERLKNADDAPAMAAEIARQIVVAAVTSTRKRQEPRLTLSAACRGVMGGMLLIEKDLPKTAVALLSQMGAVAQEAYLDPADCMTWAMEGMAPVCRLAPEPVRDAVRDAIETNFMGAGQVFSNIVQTAGA